MSFAEQEFKKTISGAAHIQHSHDGSLTDEENAALGLNSLTGPKAQEVVMRQIAEAKLKFDPKPGLPAPSVTPLAENKLGGPAVPTPGMRGSGSYS